MGRRFSITDRNTPAALREALNIIDDLPSEGTTKEVKFHLEAPKCGKLPLFITVDGGRKFFLCNIGDMFPMFLQMKDWMERALRSSPRGLHHCEILNIDSPDGPCCRIILLPTGGESSARSRRNTPVCLFIVLRSDMKEPVEYCFCNLYETPLGLYCAILRCLEKNSSGFDSWEIPRRGREFICLHRSSAPGKSKRWDNFSIWKSTFDEMCQSHFLPLRRTTQRDINENIHS